MIKILFPIIAAIAVVATANAASTRVIEAENTEKFFSAENKLKNSGWEPTKGTSSWTASGGTLTTTSTAANVGRGSASGSWDSSAAAQTLTSSAVTITSGDGLSGQNVTASVFLKCATGSCAHKLRLYDGTNVLSESAITSSTTGFVRTSVTGPAPASGTLSARLISVSANEPILYIDDGYLGLSAGFNTFQLSQATLYGTASWVPVAACEWTSATDQAPANFAADADCNTPTTTGAASAPATKVPAITFASLPPGRYRFVAHGVFLMATAGSQCNWRFSDGVNPTSPEVWGMSGSGNSISGGIAGDVTIANGQSNATYNIQATGNAAAATCNLRANNAMSPLEISVYRFPTSSEQAFRPDQVASSWSGFFNNDCLWPITQTGYTADFPVDTTCTFNERTNRNMGTVTSANNGTPGSNLPGITFTPDAVKDYHACAAATVRADDNIASGALQMIDGAGTVIGDSAGTWTGASSRGQLTVCGIYRATSVAPVTLRLRGKSQSGVFNIDTNASSPTGPLSWTIIAINQSLPAPLLVGSVTQPGGGVMNLVTGYFAGATLTSSCTASPCTLYNSTGITSVTRPAGAGIYHLNFPASSFSAMPNCWCNPSIGGAGYACAFDPANSSSTVIRLNIFVPTTGAGGDGAASFGCMGNK